MRVFLKILLAVVLLGLLGLAIFLVPAHIQIRGVEPELPSDLQLRALLTVDNGPVSIRYVNTSEQKMPVGKLGHTVFLVEWANGDLFMIDAGMDHEAALQFSGLMESLLGAQPATIHGNIAELLGEHLKRVVGVGFTHLHIDHTQGVLSFCEARGTGASRYQTSWQAELHNFNTEESADLLELSCLTPGELVGEGLMTIDGLPGLGMAGLGGHTPGSTLFAIAVQGHLFLLSGDTTNTKPDLLNDRGKEFLYSNFIVPEHTARTDLLRPWLTRLDGQADMTVVVSHDLADIEAGELIEFQK